VEEANFYGTVHGERSSKPSRESGDLRSNTRNTTLLAIKVVLLYTRFPDVGITFGVRGDTEDEQGEAPEHHWNYGDTQSDHIHTTGRFTHGEANWGKRKPPTRGLHCRVRLNSCWCQRLRRWTPQQQSTKSKAALFTATQLHTPHKLHRCTHRQQRFPPWWTQESRLDAS